MKTNADNFEYIDFHTHMHDKAFDLDSSEVMQSILDKNIACVTIGTDIVESRRAKALSDKYFNFKNKEGVTCSNIFYTIGVHPHDELSATFDNNNEKDFEELLYILDENGNKIKNKMCVAIGECGLDYFYLKSDKEKGLIENMDREVDKQKDIFINQIKFAIKHNLPLMIHGRCSVKDEIDNPTGMDAYEDILEILEKFYKKEIRNENRLGNNSQEKVIEDKKEIINGNVHFFVGDIKIAQRFIDIGFTFSFGGVLTLTQDYDEVIRYIPIERIHAETDSPYVNPKDKDGKKIILSIEKSLQNKTEEERKLIEKNNRNRNSSENIGVIVAKIAELKSLDLEIVKIKLKQNFANFLRL